MRLKKSWLVKQLGGVSATARFFGINKASVSVWPEHIPPLRAYQLRDMNPALFEKALRASGKRAAGQRAKSSRTAVPRAKSARAKGKAPKAAQAPATAEASAS